ncbi:MAG: EAL domain-containing protein [Pseudomonadota bacterium]
MRIEPKGNYEDLEEALAAAMQNHELTQLETMNNLAPHEGTERKAERDLVALGIAFGAICLFVATGGSVLPGVFRSIIYGDASPSNLLASALLLNIALVVFSWRRYRQLREEIAQREAAEQHLRVLSRVDPLTGCLNRRAMAEQSEAMRRSAKAEGLAIAYVMIDADNFKQINDMYGHAAGDAVLVEFTKRLRKVLPKDACLARLGGDEFAFTTLYDPAHPERIDDIVIRLYERMSKSIDSGGTLVEVAVSIGIATDYSKHGSSPLITDANALMQYADIAMYHAKKQGKNRFFWFENSMESELRFRNELEAGVRRGIANREFVPFYEQQIDIETGDIVGFEMLARWRSPQLGLVSPDIFIPIAEDIGVIAEMSDQLMDQAFLDAREWSDAISLSINISPVQMRDPWFAQKLLKRLVAANFPPQRLEIEVTESCLHENLDLVRTMIISLRNQGVRVSLDDFGTGYSSLAQLKSLPFDRLKIDRSFIRDLSDEDGESRIVDAIVLLGRGLDLPITAEGIEDEQILIALKKIGDLKGQGYLYGRPEPAEDVRQRLEMHGLLNVSSGVTEDAPQAAKRERIRLDERDEGERMQQLGGSRV